MKEYGITTSRAHYWLHVCPQDASFYFYARAKMAATLTNFKQVRIDTAIGHLVPVIANKRENGGALFACDLTYEFFSLWEWVDATKQQLGDRAEACFEVACRRGLFRMPVVATRYDDRADQFQGKDFACSLKQSTTDVEVKCERDGGIFGTGNLFVQTNERRDKAA